MTKKIKTVGLFGKYRDQAVIERLSQLERFLSERKLAVVLEQTTAEHCTTSRAPSYPLATIGKEIDLAISVGGDGTLLNAARVLAQFHVPLIGVNMGRLGFLTDIPAEHMTSEIGKILDGAFHQEDRLLLRAEIIRGDKTVYAADALNDVIVNKGELARMIEFETYLDDEFVHNIRGDGIIVASPTGSTAYALSSGGPILHPTLGAIAIVPVCPHTLSNRAIVVSSDSVVEIRVSRIGDQHSHATMDGQATFALQDGDRVRVRRADHVVELWHPVNRSHFEMMRIKLHWGR